MKNDLTGPEDSGILPPDVILITQNFQGITHITDSLTNTARIEFGFRPFTDDDADLVRVIGKTISDVFERFHVPVSAMQNTYRAGTMGTAPATIVKVIVTCPDISEAGIGHAIREFNKTYDPRRSDHARRASIAPRGFGF
ncbi:MAG: hypothetical protein AB7H77_08540 [Bdellovibrionales bacterium]